MVTASQGGIESTSARLSHGDRVELNVNSENLFSEPVEIFASWRRCFLNYRVDTRNLSAPPLVLDIVTVAARAIEERLFRENFHHLWTIAVLPSDNGPALLLAVDEHQWILGADRIARNILGLDDDEVASGVPLSAAFEFDRRKWSGKYDLERAAY